MGNIKYHCWPWNDALWGGRCWVRQAEGAAGHLILQERKANPQSRSWREVGGWVGDVLATLRGPAAQGVLCPLHRFPTAFLV